MTSYKWLFRLCWTTYQQHLQKGKFLFGKNFRNPSNKGLSSGKNLKSILQGWFWAGIYSFHMKSKLRILFQNCPIFRFRPSSQLWHPSFSPLYDVFNLTTHVFSESLWHVLFTDAPVMTMKKTHANTKTKTKTMTKTKWLKDLACAIFFKMIWLKDIKSDDESVMHH